LSQVVAVGPVARDQPPQRAILADRVNQSGPAGNCFHTTRSNGWAGPLFLLPLDREEDRPTRREEKEKRREEREKRNRGEETRGEDEARRQDGRRRPVACADPYELRPRAAGMPSMPPRQDLRPGTRRRRHVSPLPTAAVFSSPIDLVSLGLGIWFAGNNPVRFRASCWCDLLGKLCRRLL
jgi:hypothetical protein